MNNVLKSLARLLPDDILFGKSFRYAKKIHSTFIASNDPLDFAHSVQQERLKNILKIASKAPFYQYLKELRQFDEIPFTNKEIILGSFNDFIISKKNTDYVSTGGTSGKPLEFYINKNRKGFEWFWMTNNWGKVGFTLKDYRAVLRNQKLNGKKYKIDSLLREYQYNNFALTDNYLKFVIEHINSKKLKFLHAYPSAAFQVASYLKNQKQETTLTTFLCGSENVLKYQKELIQDNLKIRMYTFYGHSEKLIMAGESETCENYHCNPFYGYTEIIDINSKPIRERGGIGELTGTGFINTQMPFVRYKTGDFAEYVGETCPVCGHIGLTFKNVKGRWEGDKIYKADDAVITTTALNLHNNYYKYIKGLQYFQSEKGKLQVRVVPEKDFTPNIKPKILEELKSKAGDGLEIEIIEVNAVEYSVNNKFQLLIQKIKPEQK